MSKLDEIKAGVDRLLTGANNANELVRAQKNELEAAVELSQDKIKELVNFVIENYKELGVQEIKGKDLVKFFEENDGEYIHGVIVNGEAFSGEVVEEIRWEKVPFNGIHVPDDIKEDEDNVLRFDAEGKTPGEIIYLTPEKLGRDLEKFKYQNLSEEKKKRFGIKA